MSVHGLIEKYELPETVRVEVVQDDDGSYFAKLPDYAGCMTVAGSQFELILNLTDAILTYFEVPREEAINVDIIYFPKVSPKTVTEKLKTEHFYLLASQRQRGGDTSIRTA
jgi:predicted RNase H-like HicB family nuclease